MYCKLIENGYIIAVGVNINGAEISEEEYREIIGVIRSMPSAPEGYEYRLTASLDWELHEIPAAEEDPELTDSEALNLIVNGGTA